jgi:hypothetical protein
MILNPSALYLGQENLLVLISALCIAKVFKHNNIFSNYTSHVVANNKKFQLFVVSLFSGILPVEGRISVCLPLYEGISTNCCNSEDHINTNQKMGMISYLATHHYYLWSPLEKSVIIIMAGLHLTYMQFLELTYPFLLTYITFLALYIFTSVEEQEVEFKPDLTTKALVNEFNVYFSMFPFLIGIACSIFLPTYYVFPLVASFYIWYYKQSIIEIAKKLNWSLVVQVSAIIVLSNLIKDNAALIENMLKITDTGSIVVISTVMFLAIFSSFVLGSSSKYAGITVALCNVIGIALFPMIFALEYCGYLLSPIHKCTIIAHRAFKTPLVDFYKVISVLALFLISVGIINTVLR